MKPMPLMLTKPLRVLVIGGGRAAEIKAVTALRFEQQVTFLSLEFSQECLALDCECVKADFYQCDDSFFKHYDLIYIALPWPTSLPYQKHIVELTTRLIHRGKLICVSCQPRLGNVVNPCSRIVGNNVVTVSGSGKQPKQTRKYAQILAQILEVIKQGYQSNEGSSSR